MSMTFLSVFLAIFRQVFMKKLGINTELCYFVIDRYQARPLKHMLHRSCSNLCKGRALEEGGLGFRIQISNRHGIQDSNFKQGGIQDSDFSLPVCCAFEICILYIRHDFWVSWFSEICI